MESNQQEGRKSILSGITPSGILTIGHYTGAIKNWVELQNDYDCYFMVADLHAITVRQQAADLRKRTLEIIAMYIASGIDYEKCTLFIQSQVSQHAELAWVLNTFTGMGECSRMTQFKDKSQKEGENSANVGLFTYPVLMASDILLYQADLVPVGEDQKQHLELTRDLAQRFNHIYSPTFKIPEPFIPKVGAKVMSLQDPTKKMSKSDENQNSILYLNDTNEQIRNKIKRAVTDSDTKVYYHKDKPGIANLMTLYSVATGIKLETLDAEFETFSYGEFKSKVADAMVEYLSPIRDKYEDLLKNKDFLNSIIKSGAEKATYQANKTLRKVYKKVGFVEKQ
jgi:tryptophanyl-tRNA synthetase